MTSGPIVFATDFSVGSARGWPIAQMLARATKTALLVVHVAPGEPTARLGPFYASLADPNVSAVARQLVESASAPPDLACEHRILEGDPAGEIVRLARQESAAMIVIGTHGRTGAKRLLMGSVAEAVIRGAVPSRCLSRTRWRGHLTLIFRRIRLGSAAPPPLQPLRFPTTTCHPARIALPRQPKRLLQPAVALARPPSSRRSVSSSRACR